MPVIKIFILFYATTILFIFSIGVNLINMIQKYIKNKYIEMDQPYLHIYIITIWALTFIGFVLGISNKFWQRTLSMAYIVYPVLYGISYIKINTQKKNYIMLLVISIIAIATTIEFYDHPYFIPPASTAFSNITSDDPLLYRGNVNSVYQRDVVLMSEKVIRGSIASDRVTNNQLRGFTNRDFYYQYVIRYYPPDTIVYPDLEIREYEFLLLHLPGISGPFQERAILRSDDVILKMIYSDVNVLYTNSQSFILKVYK
jgi:hypothetical protein